jgi:hypothetical protein
VPKMNILFVGDSNFRDVFTYLRDKVEKSTRTSVKFEQATSVASTKTILDVAQRDVDLIFIGPPTNEISLKSRNNTKGREGIIESVVTELYNVVNDHAAKNEKTLYVLGQPFLRLDPAWIEAKLGHYKEFMKSSLNNLNLGNVHIGSEIEITVDDIKFDKVHLNKEGLKKLANLIIQDIKTGIKEVRVLRSGEVESQDDDRQETDMDVEDFDAEDIPLSQSGRILRKTPARRKRTIEEVSDEEGKSKKKRGREEKIDSVLEKLDLLFVKMDKEQVNNKERFDKIEEKIVETSKSHSDLKIELEQFKKSENSFAANLREDMDAMENLNARDTVVIKKFKVSGTIPTDKKELTDLIIATGKELLTLILGHDQGMKFIAPLYYRNDKRSEAAKEATKNELPPFRITFKHMTEAIDFKEKAIIASKDAGHRLFKAHISNIQNMATRIRSNIMWSIVDSLKKENKEGWVNQSSPKPAMMVKTTSGKGVVIKTYSYTEAVMTYEDKIDAKVKEDATRLASRFYHGQVEKIFIVLKD